MLNSTKRRLVGHFGRTLEFGLLAVACCMPMRAGWSTEHADDFTLEGRAPFDRITPEHAAGGIHKPAPAFESMQLPEPYAEFDLGPWHEAPFGNEFRPRGPSLSAPNHPPGGANSARDLTSTTFWERMSDFKSRRGIRLLTLWDRGIGTLSLQAGHSGSPSLQWTSQSMHAGEAKRGVFDRMFSTSIGESETALRPRFKPAANPRAAESGSRDGELTVRPKD